MHTINGFSGEFDFLSNFYVCPVPMVFGYDDIIAKTSEHVYQAAKAQNEQEMFEILACSTPGQAKRMGKIVTRRPNWKELKNNIMYVTQKNKFDYNSNLKNKLIQTYPMCLIESNTWGDTYWGQCNGVGFNHLGKILTNLRLGYVIGLE